MKLKSTLVLCLFSFLQFSNVQAQSNALQFDGTNDFVELPQRFNLGTDNFTFEVWIKPASTVMGMVYAQDISGNAHHQFRLRILNSTAIFNFSGANGTPSVQVTTAANTVPTGEWTHVAVTRDGGTVNIYLNGVLSASGSSALIDNQSGADATKPFRIGARGSSSHPNGQDPFNGVIDELRYWNKARTAAEIKSNLFKAPAANAPGLVAMYRFNAGSGTTLVNSCTNTTGIDGTLTNGPVWTASPITANDNALYFDGTNDVVAVGAPTPSNSSFTKEAWVNIPSHAGNLNIISSNWAPFWITGGRLSAGIANNYSYVVDPASFPLNTWVHVAVTFDDPTNTMRLYRDGNLVATNTNVTASYTAENTFIGSHAGSQSFFLGRIDEVRFWNVARTQAQIQNNRSTELNPLNEPDLAAYYNFNHGVTAGNNSGLRVVPDLKGNFNGTMTNFALNGATSNFVTQNAGLITLPVTWKDFTATLKDNKVVLQWSTEYEENTRSFTVQHRADNADWKNIFITSAAGNSNTAKYYDYTHQAPSTGTNYYRILQTDLDGRFSYSEVKRVLVETNQKSFSIKNTIISNGILQVQTQQAVYLRVFNSAGKLVLQKSLAAGTHEISLSNAGSGIYYVQADDIVRKIILHKK